MRATATTPSIGPACWGSCARNPAPRPAPRLASTPVHPSRVVPPAPIAVQSVAVAEPSARSGKGVPGLQPEEEEGKAMTHGTGHFAFESIVYVVLTVLVVSTLTMFANAVLNSTAVV